MFNIGDKVVISGPLYVSSNATSPSGSVNNKVTEITRKAVAVTTMSFLIMFISTIFLNL